MSCKVFIDGSSGTTGLRIAERLARRPELELLSIPEAGRKDLETRAEVINAADLAFLCLPDAASREILPRIGGQVKVLDTSTAHRTNPDWDYGFAELSENHRNNIVRSKRVANPGCHASGFIASVYPLVQRGVIPAHFPLTCYSLTGYSGGGKSMIAEYEAEGREACYDSCRIYGLTLQHKHLPEMQKICGLDRDPVFAPVVGDYPQGMATTVLLPWVDAKLAHEALCEHYAGQALVSVAPLGGDAPMIYSNALSGKDTMRLVVYGHQGQTAVTAVFDNLGKGASGAAVQNMNLMLGFDETCGLSL